jgi:hypothetical protein
LPTGYGAAGRTDTNVFSSEAALECCGLTLLLKEAVGGWDGTKKIDRL